MPLIDSGVSDDKVVETIDQLFGTIIPFLTFLYNECEFLEEDKEEYISISTHILADRPIEWIVRVPRPRTLLYLDAQLHLGEIDEFGVKPARASRIAASYNGFLETRRKGRPTDSVGA